MYLPGQNTFIEWVCLVKPSNHARYHKNKNILIRRRITSGPPSGHLRPSFLAHAYSMSESCHNKKYCRPDKGMDGRELGQVSTLVNRKNMTSECSILSTLVYLPGQNTYSMGQNTKQYKNCGGGKSGNQTVPRSKKLLIQTTPHVLTQRQIKPYTRIRICTYMYRLRSNQIEKEAIKLTLLISSLASRQDLLAEVSFLTLP